MKKLTDERINEFIEFIEEALNEEDGEVWNLLFLKKEKRRVSFFLEISAAEFLKNLEDNWR